MVILVAPRAMATATGHVTAGTPGHKVKTGHLQTQTAYAGVEIDIRCTLSGLPRLSQNFPLNLILKISSVLKPILKFIYGYRKI